MKAILTILFLVTTVATLHLSHFLWNTKNKKLAKVTDILWNYCDLKCLYLQNYSKGNDFVVITFEHLFPPYEQRADCYQKDRTHYDHWSTVINNTMFSNICWDEKNIDLIKRTDYKVLKIQGEGIGTEIPPF